ncbi:MAG TPA: 3-keto-5-aminohexanoate cleavage protein [Amycolatopsis sp.]|uniref:3-keto-5-aminohexanoate cleavage protein n=1 Tax=Amycolatopsis sp. TaxID=37632 RepID=UPI002B47DA0B|nr:3-keto-5-aminohexanoate cleavage protein [Amycolatopsis sp.]HKS50183.1 3-keto-5-aminohexanoate cleavage protein [Amycolatopsis sp.]
MIEEVCRCGRPRKPGRGREIRQEVGYKKGEVGTNLQLRERLVRIARDMGFEPATPADARQMLGLPLKNTDVEPGFAV